MASAKSIPSTPEVLPTPSKPWIPTYVRGHPPTQDEGCTHITSDREYYRLDGVFVKRTLRPDGNVVLPLRSNDRIRNEVACLRFVRENTDVLVPKVVCVFEDDESVYTITEAVEGVNILDLDAGARRVMEKELRAHRRTLWGLRSKRIGGPTGIVLLLARVYVGRKDLVKIKLRDSQKEEFFFCHNHYAQQNVIVDPETLKIKAILDWEYAGFYPRWIDRSWYKR